MGHFKFTSERNIPTEVVEVKDTATNIFAHPFNKEMNFLLKPQKEPKLEQIKRLNAMDSEIYENSFEQDEEIPMQLEMKISKIQEELKDVSSQMELASTSTLDLEWKNLEALKKREKELKDTLFTYKAEYNRLNPINGFFSFFTDAILELRNAFRVLFGETSAKAQNTIPALQKRYEFKENLEKINLINQKIEVLTKPNTIPIGEKEKRFQEIEDYMSKAYKIDAELKKITKEEAAKKSAQTAKKVKTKAVFKRLKERLDSQKLSTYFNA